ncbi:3'-5' exonuclease [Arthrobacter mobilis]|uniref:3'-5' exonuclease n=1 Tax=Arthrobacter mobilis TaxID=2724944 RepID=A0A7X6HB21_9MICC|nr:3'-5' exonuclease [Arthrobacter mobilis]NKX53788.1 3'-5' exonuclease [Arthrobacter mobilis]
MNSWHELPRAAFDVETTGRDPHEARIVTASIVLVNGRGAPLQQHEWLVNPGVPIPEEAAAIHGITTERARKEGQDAAEAVAQIAGTLAGYFAAGIPVMAFNAAYDFTVLAAECRRRGLAAPAPRPVIDPYILDKQMDRYRRGKRTLVALSELYQVGLDAAHTSAADALATIGVADALARKYGTLRMEPGQLHDSQVGWAAAQAASFQEWLRRKQPDAVVDGVWPVRQPAGGCHT